MNATPVRSSEREAMRAALYEMLVLIKIIRKGRLSERLESLDENRLEQFYDSMAAAEYELVTAYEVLT